MERPLLHVVSFVLRTQADADDALRRLRRLSPEDGAQTLLLFADFPSAAALRLPHESALLRRLQSGIMAMNARRPGRFQLLARRRVWNDAARQYFGAEQPLSCRAVIAQLLRLGETEAAFESATVSPGSLRGRYEAVLFSDGDLLCTPDMPARMCASLARSASGCVVAAVRSPRLYPETVFARLVRLCGFSLSPLAAAQNAWQSRHALADTTQPTLYTAQALMDSLTLPPDEAPAAVGCFFLRRAPLTLAQVYAAYRLRALHRAGADAALPLIQLALLLACALSGAPVLMALALLPEALALLHPRLLPGALLRTALLPLTAAVSLDALLCRRFARAKLFRLRVPERLISAQGVMLTGAAFLPMALVSAQALAPLLPLLLLWLGAPLLLPALASPTLERIPLSDGDQALLRSLAENAYFGAAQAADEPPALRMLTACAACMLGLLEPDEAARQAAALPDTPPASPAAHAALLVCAQFFRENMGACDAALRRLPAQLEARARTRAAAPYHSGTPVLPIDVLFLPLAPAKTTAMHDATLPLTHPHTFLKRQLMGVSFTGDPVLRFLALTAAALGHPFHALLMRSPAAAPYAPLLYTV